MDILDLAVKALASNLGKGGSDSDQIRNVVSKLVGSGDSLDLAGLVDGLKGQGLGKIAESWLGDGDNEEISVEQIKNVLGGEQVAEAANSLGADEGMLLDGLKNLLPQMVDKSSRGGSLLETIGGIATKFL